MYEDYPRGHGFNSANDFYYVASQTLPKLDEPTAIVDCSYKSQKSQFCPSTAQPTSNRSTNPFLLLLFSAYVLISIIETGLQYLFRIPFPVSLPQEFYRCVAFYFGITFPFLFYIFFILLPKSKKWYWVIPLRLISWGALIHVFQPEVENCAQLFNLIASADFLYATLSGPKLFFQWLIEYPLTCFFVFLG